MLIRRARTYDIFCSQEIVVYLHPFRRNSLLFSQKIAVSWHDDRLGYEHMTAYRILWHRLMITGNITNITRTLLM